MSGKGIIEGRFSLRENQLQNLGDNLYNLLPDIRNAVLSLITPPDVNLTPYKPSEWLDKIVVSKTTGTNIDSSPLYTTDTLYIDWAVINNGTGAITNTFYFKLYVDGVERGNFSIAGLNANVWAYASDYSIGTLSAGTHYIKILADVTGAVQESNESDNEYTKTITVNNVICTYSISPTSRSHGSGSETGSVGVTASSGSCSWTAASNASWITITSGSIGAGNGTVSYSVSANAGTSTRTGTMTIAGQTFIVTQDVVSCEAETLTVFPGKLPLKRMTSGDVTVAVTGVDDCAVEGETVTATINKAGKRRISISPTSAMTDGNGEAAFTITARNKTGIAKVIFNADSLKKSITVRVKK
ncbi:MAG: hypothetical protein NUV74_07440 [Candidatus Brocadiaceae bacterium]|nr:hypothetical protein [Candidatus Brocadiaceae bacterium]